MAKLYFKYGVMGCSKTAQALMTKFNYEQRGKKVWLIKPSLDTRDGENTITSRIGLSSKCDVIAPDDNVLMLFNHKYDTVIADEIQFFTVKQIEELKELAEAGYPVICFGLKTDFRTKLFDASKRLFEIADSISEIKTICDCGNKAVVNARYVEGKCVGNGNVVEIGGDEMYKPMCYKCWKKALDKNN